MAIDIGKRLASERGRLGMTQAEVGARIGRTAQSVSNWENGRSVPGTRDVQRLGALGYDLDHVLLGRRLKPLDSDVRGVL